MAPQRRKDSGDAMGCYNEAETLYTVNSFSSIPVTGSPGEGEGVCILGPYRLLLVAGSSWLKPARARQCDPLGHVTNCSMSSRGWVLGAKIPLYKALDRMPHNVQGRSASLFSFSHILHLLVSA